jgi:hypothetical protein
MAKSKRTTAIQTLLYDEERAQLDRYRRSLENPPPRGTAMRELALIGLRVVMAEAQKQKKEKAAAQGA